MIKLILLVLLGLVLVTNGAEGKHVVKRSAMKDKWLWPGGVVFYRFHRNLGAEGKHVVKRSAMKDKWLWPGGVVFYRFHRNLDNAGRDRLREAMKHIEDRTCIRFRQRTNEPNYVVMQYDFNKGACKSAVGFEGGVQGLWIANPKVTRETGYCKLGQVIHELGHTLGFFHEQARPDRDNYVRIFLKNLAQKYKWAKGQFDKVDRRYVASRGVGYDYGSIMHYGKTAFAARGKITVQPKDRDARIGQRRALSNADIDQLSKMYNC